MSDADSDRLDARLTGIEATVEQLDTRVGRVEDQLDTMNGRIDDLNQHIDDRFASLRQDMRRWVYILLVAVTATVTAVTAIVQIALAG